MSFAEKCCLLFFIYSFYFECLSVSSTKLTYTHLLLHTIILNILTCNVSYCDIYFHLIIVEYFLLLMLKFQNVGIDKGDIPDLTKAPSSLLDALEQHLASIEGKKSSTSTPTQSARYFIILCTLPYHHVLYTVFVSTVRI